MRERVRDAFNQITADEKLKEQTKMFLAQKRRQAPARRPVRRMAAILVCLMCLVSVSYTHLDVYKRQL